MKATTDKGKNRAPRKLGLTFHRTFSLNRPAMADIIRLAANEGQIESGGKCLTRQAIRELTNLGTIYVEAMPRYCYGTGLLDGNNCLTAFGARALQDDPFLNSPASQWLLHYYLSTPMGPGPGFWTQLVTSQFQVGSEFTAKELASELVSFVEKTEARSTDEARVRSTATAFLGTYLKPEALGALAILERVGEGAYRIAAPKAAPVWACAYALIDYWQANFRDQVSINEDALTGRGGFCDLLMIGGGHLNTVLRAMEEAGYVERYRVSPPYQVVLLRQAPEPLLERMYGLS